MNNLSAKPILTTPYGNVCIEVPNEPDKWSCPGDITVFESGVITVSELFEDVLVSTQSGTGIVKVVSDEDIALLATPLRSIDESCAVKFEIPGRDEVIVRGHVDYYSSGLVVVRDGRKEATLLNANAGRITIHKSGEGDLFS